MFRFRYQKTVVVLLALIAGLMIPVAGLRAQSVQSEAAKAAGDLYRAQDWEKAVAAYEKLLADESEFGLGWIHLGISHSNLKQYREAIEAYARAVKLGFAPQIAHYNIAAARALLGEADDAFAALEKAIDVGYGNAGQFEQDDDFAALRTDARFADALGKIKINSAPCEYLPEYRQFDFWVGDWEVFGPSGRKAGENKIEKVGNGCVLRENWTGSGGGQGKSMNYYDHSTREWVQVWVGGGADVLPARGGLVDGSMVLKGKHYLRDGRVQEYRGTWTPLEDGRVRQFLEKSNDGGETWFVWFDGYYKRKAAGADAQ